MTILVALSIACVAFIVGFCLGLMGIAIAGSLFRKAAEHDSCALEGDQTSQFGQRSSPSR